MHTQHIYFRAFTGRRDAEDANLKCAKWRFGKITCIVPPLARTRDSMLTRLSSPSLPLSLSPLSNAGAAQRCAKILFSRKVPPQKGSRNVPQLGADAHFRIISGVPTQASQSLANSCSFSPHHFLASALAFGHQRLRSPLFEATPTTARVSNGNSFLDTSSPSGFVTMMYFCEKAREAKVL